jgi:hypothetical protein
MMNLGTIVRPVPNAGLFAVSDQIVIGGTHHDAVLLDQAVWDALGSEGWAVRRQAAFDASYALIGAIAKRLGIEGDREIVDLATELFGTLGLGQLRFEIGATGGEVFGSDLLFGGGFRERYGESLRLRHHADAFAAGFAAAAASIAYPSDWGSFEAEETRCIVRGDASCAFTLSRRPQTFQPAEGLARHDAEQLAGPDSPPESDPVPVGLFTRDLVASCVANEKGIIRIGDTRFAVLPAAYRAQLTYDTLHLIEKRASSRGAGGKLAPLFVELARDATRTGMFHLIGSLYDSAPMRDAFGVPPTDPHELVEQLAAVAGALGWGSLGVTELVPKERLVVSVTLTPEVVYYAARHGGTPMSRLPGLQGLAEALALLVTHVDFSRGEGVPSGLYEGLMTESVPFHVEETRSILSGDRECEVVVDMR